MIQCLVVLALVLAAGVCQADVIRFKDGSTLKGRVVKRTSERIVVQFEFGTMEFTPEEIVSVEDEPLEVPTNAVAEPPAPALVSDRPGPPPASAEPPAVSPELSLPLALRAVAYIKVMLEDGTEGGGTGTIISPNGTMLTNHHVVEGAKKLFVTLHEEKAHRFKDAKEYEATVIKSNRYYDLALIDIHASTPAYLRFAADAAVKVGAEVRAIGNPWGLQSTVSKGIMSAVRTNHSMRVEYAPIAGEYINEREFEEITWIQTDASINPGNSGGPLLNDQHQIVGINTAIYTTTGGSMGLNFALHAKHARKFAAGYAKP